MKHGIIKGNLVKKFQIIKLIIYIRLQKKMDHWVENYSVPVVAVLCYFMYQKKIKNVSKRK
jgi:hypothetical protein